ncbi:MAG: hypothetical protein Q9218_001841 [Villophora microphyllina]
MATHLHSPSTTPSQSWDALQAYVETVEQALFHFASQNPLSKHLQKAYEFSLKSADLLLRDQRHAQHQKSNAGKQLPLINHTAEDSSGTFPLGDIDPSSLQDRSSQECSYLDCPYTESREDVSSHLTAAVFGAMSTTDPNAALCQSAVLTLAFTTMLDPSLLDPTLKPPTSAATTPAMTRHTLRTLVPKPNPQNATAAYGVDDMINVSDQQEELLTGMLGEDYLRVKGSLLVFQRMVLADFTDWRSDLKVESLFIQNALLSGDELHFMMMDQYGAAVERSIVAIYGKTVQYHIVDRQSNTPGPVIYKTPGLRTLMEHVADHFKDKRVGYKCMFVDTILALPSRHKAEDHFFLPTAHNRTLPTLPNSKCRVTHPSYRERHHRLTNKTGLDSSSHHTRTSTPLSPTPTAPPSQSPSAPPSLNMSAVLTNLTLTGLDKGPWLCGILAHFPIYGQLSLVLAYLGYHWRYFIGCFCARDRKWATMIHPAAKPFLSKEELRIVSMLRDGLSFGEIAEDMLGDVLGDGHEGGYGKVQTEYHDASTTTNNSETAFTEDSDEKWDAKRGEEDFDLEYTEKKVKWTNAKGYRSGLFMGKHAFTQ